MATVYGTAPLVHTTTPAVHEQAVAPVAAVVQPQLAVQAQALPTIAVPVAAPAVVAAAPVQPMMEVASAKMPKRKWQSIVTLAMKNICQSQVAMQDIWSCRNCPENLRLVCGTTSESEICFITLRVPIFTNVFQCV